MTDQKPYWAEFELRSPGGVRRVLMMRRRASDGVWSDIATFDSYNDAEHVLGLLKKATDRTVEQEIVPVEDCGCGKGDECQYDDYMRGLVAIIDKEMPDG